MGPSTNPVVRNAQIRLTAGFVSKLGLLLIATPLLVAVLGVPAHLSHLSPAMRLLLGLWWAGLGAYLLVLALKLLERVR